jgi:predicted secreted protein
MAINALNGTKVLLKKAMSDGRQLVIGAGQSNSSNYQRAAVEYNTKSDPDYRYYLDGDEGTKSADHTFDVLFSSDEAYQEVREDFHSGNIGTYFLVPGDDTDKEAEFKFKVSNFTDAPDRNTATTTSITFTSSDSFEKIKQLVRAVDSNLVYAVDSNGQYAISEA